MTGCCKGWCHLDWHPLGPAFYPRSNELLAISVRFSADCQARHGISLSLSLSEGGSCSDFPGKQAHSIGVVPSISFNAQGLSAPHLMSVN